MLCEHEAPSSNPSPTKKVKQNKNPSTTKNQTKSNKQNKETLVIQDSATIFY
jgi:hypothetical protein